MKAIRESAKEMERREKVAGKEKQYVLLLFDLIFG